MLPRSIRLDSTWGKRIVRVWIVLLLPIAAICGYLAFDHHAISISEKQKEQELYKELNNFDESGHAEIVGGKAYLKSRANLANSNSWRNRDDRDHYLALSFVILIAPAIFLFLYSVVMWMWLGPKSKAQKKDMLE